MQSVDQRGRPATVAEFSEDQREILPHARIIVFRRLVDIGDLLDEIRIPLRFSPLDRLRELVSRLELAVTATAPDVTQVFGDRLLLLGEFAEEKKDEHGDEHHAEGEDHELEEDGAGGFFGDVGQSSTYLPVPATTKSGRYPLSCVGASGTTIASLSQTDSQRRHATHFALSTNATL